MARPEQPTPPAYLAWGSIGIISSVTGASPPDWPHSPSPCAQPRDPRARNLPLTTGSMAPSFCPEDLPEENPERGPAAEAVPPPAAPEPEREEEEAEEEDFDQAAYAALDRQLDALDRALDNIEERNDNLHGQLKGLLETDPPGRDGSARPETGPSGPA
eukprot:maker-scaffold2199_size18937-snap-gene-0.3 protein:Tk00521 transcript:maker-scaffold2199_size18937-snap-gene-0.3-mRNA-1 annotation:"upf0184 protein c9orf16 homolog"